MQTKTCRICNQEKDISLFSINRSRKDGLHYNCKPCDSKKTLEWAKNNPEKNKARQKSYRAKNLKRLLQEDQNRYWSNREIHLCDRKKYYLSNKDRVLKRVDHWSSQNRDKTRMYVRRHYQKNKSSYLLRVSLKRAQKSNATPIWLTAIQKAMIQEFYDIAEAKTVQTGVLHHVDHIHPLKGKNVCGLHAPWNLRVITAQENLSKGNRMLEEKFYAMEAT